MNTDMEAKKQLGGCHTGCLWLVMVFGVISFYSVDRPKFIARYFYPKLKGYAKIYGPGASDPEPVYLLFKNEEDSDLLRGRTFYLEDFGSGSFNSYAFSEKSLIAKKYYKGINRYIIRYWEKPYLIRQKGNLFEIKAINSYTITYDKWFKADMISNQRDLKAYCMKINSYRSDLKREELDSDEIRKLVEFHLYNHYKDFIFVSGNIKDSNLTKEQINRINEVSKKFVLEGFKKGVYNYDFIIEHRIDRFYNYRANFKSYKEISFTIADDGTVNIKEKNLTDYIAVSQSSNTDPEW